MKMQLTGIPQLQKALAEFAINADRELENIVRGTAQNIRGHAIKSILRGQKSGTEYQKYSPKRKHRASAPGQAPATDTGRLAGSIAANIDGKKAEIVANAEYAAWLEFGTQEIKPRPFMFPAMELERPKWNKRLEGVVEKAAKGIIK
jgi:HK97 gp10 family phage protein